jgi:hypothetical protein
MIIRRSAHVFVCLVAVAALGWGPPPPAPAEGEDAFAMNVESPTAKVGQATQIVATISTGDGYRITESYRHRIVNIISVDDGVHITSKVVRGSVESGRVVFRVEVVPKTAGSHIVAGVLRFSINNGRQLDIKAAPFEATVMVTE